MSDQARHRKSFTREGLVAWLAAQCQLESQKAVAERYGVSQQFLSDILRHRREVGNKLLKGLGLRRVVKYVSVT